LTVEINAALARRLAVEAAQRSLDPAVLAGELLEVWLADAPPTPGEREAGQREA
jgi:hypothetical protein